MLLLVAATTMELAAVQERLAGVAGVDFLLGGVGILETAVHLAARLQDGDVTQIINFGVCGAYLTSNFPLLHLCLAQEECVTDLGIDSGDGWQDLSADLPITRSLPADPGIIQQCQDWLSSQGHDFSCCAFATVNGVSGTAQRGNLLAQRHNVGCENMEGAAVARLANHYAIPWLELRTVSNQVTDRDLTGWRLTEASNKCAAIVSAYCRYLVNSSH